MKTKQLLLPDIKAFLQQQNFVVEFESSNDKAIKHYTETIEMLILLNRINEKKKLSSQIYLAMIHQKFSKQIHLKSPSEWQIKLLAFAGKVLGFRI
jgi:hypothetical protein